MQVSISTVIFFVVVHIFSHEQTKAREFQACLTWDKQWHHVHMLSGIEFSILTLTLTFVFNFNLKTLKDYSIGRKLYKYKVNKSKLCLFQPLSLLSVMIQKDHRLLPSEWSHLPTDIRQVVQGLCGEGVKILPERGGREGREKNAHLQGMGLEPETSHMLDRSQ